MDQLAESYHSASPYTYVCNNPVSLVDVDGRWFDEGGNIDTSGRATTGIGARARYTQFLGTTDNPFASGYIPFGDTQAYSDLMSTAKTKGAAGGLSNIGGTLRWWTDIADTFDEMGNFVEGVGQLNILKLKESYNANETNWHEYARKARTYAGHGFTLSKIFQAGYEHASLYGNPPAFTTTSLYFEKSVLGKKLLSIKLPFRQINADKALRYAKIAKGTAIGLGALGVDLGIYDIHKNGFTTSNTLDTAMSALAATPTGITQGIAGTYFLINGASALFTGKDLGQHLDENGYNLGEFINEQINDINRLHIFSINKFV